MNNTITNTLTKCQQRALNAFKSGRNVFLTGEAGTGKSFVLNRYLESIEGRQNAIICAPTGIAAINVNGATLHSVFGIPTRPLTPYDRPEIVSKVVLRADVIVIDEISMCRFDVFQYVAYSIKLAEEITGKQKQIIVVGDFFQLPPVITYKDKKILDQVWGKGTYGDGFAFHAPLWNEFNFEFICLDQPMRQLNDPAFISNLNKLRIGDCSAIQWLNSHVSTSVQKDGICLVPTNKEANEINNRAADKLSGEYELFEATSYGKVLPGDKKTADKLRLKTGMQVMMLVNDRAGRYQNGTIGIIKVMDSETNSITVRFDDGVSAEVAPYHWVIENYVLNEDDGTISKVPVGHFNQLPVKPAYAITIHKSQGQTFEKVNLNPACFASGQLYVAVSRLTSIAGLHLIRNISLHALKTSPDVLAFYNDGVA